MPLKLESPVEEIINLVETDELFGSEGTQVTIRQATMGQYKQRADYNAKRSSLLSVDGTIRSEYVYNDAELMELEVFLTMVDCNITYLNGEEVVPLFKFKVNNKGQQHLSMTRLEFSNAWAQLPIECAREIHEAVIRVNPAWGWGSARAEGE